MEAKKAAEPKSTKKLSAKEVQAEAAAEKTASLLPRAAYVPTSISEDVCQSIRFAQLEHCMVVFAR